MPTDSPKYKEAEAKLPDELLTLITELDALATQVRSLRREVGSIDLDVPEYHVDINKDGRVFGVAQIVRDRSHGLVEEFMLAANRAVASFMTEKKLPALYRVHEPPERVSVQLLRPRHGRGHGRASPRLVQRPGVVGLAPGVLPCP